MTRFLATAAFILVPLLPDAAGPPAGAPRVTGYLSQYAERPSRATLEYRIAAGDIVDPWRYDGFIATESCELIGRDAWLSIEGGPWLRVAVADCAGDGETVEWMSDNRVIAEAFYDLAVTHGFVGRGGIAAELVLEDG